MRIKSRISAAFALAVGVGLATPLPGQTPDTTRQTPPEGGEPRAFRLPEARTFALDNGMRVTLAPYGTLPKTTAELVIRAGNVNEAPDQVWLADLMGDLMEEGTTSRTAEEIAETAARMGGDVDVGVGPDAMAVEGESLSEFAPELVRLIADLALHPAFPAGELDRLKGDRLRQVSIARSQPQQLTLETFRAVLYPDHPYGRLFPTPAMLQGYTVEEIERFYRDNVGAERAHLYVSGRFDADRVEAAVREAFAGWEAGPEPETNVPDPTSERVIHLIDRPGATQSTVYIGLPVVDPSDPDYVPLLVTNALLGGSFNSRITSNIRETKGYTYSPFSQVSIRFRDAYWVQTADVTTAVTGPSLKEIFFEIDRLQEEPPTPAELEGIQNYLGGTFVLQNSTPAGIIGQLRFLDLHGLDRDYLEEYVANVRAVTPEDVSRIARDYLEDERMTIVITGDRAEIGEQIAPYGDIRIVDGSEPGPSPSLRREG